MREERTACLQVRISYREASFYVRESEELMDDARRAVSEAVDKCLSGRHTDWNKIKLVIRDSMNDYIWKRQRENRW